MTTTPATRHHIMDAGPHTFAAGLDRLWLTTEPGTRAQRFYEAAGWTLAGTTDQGELRYEKPRS